MHTDQTLVELTIWYRGVVEGRASRQIANALADGAERQGKYVQAFENYVDLPDRVYVPCRSYVRVSSEPIAEPYLYENHAPSIVVCTDASLLKGCEVLTGLQPGGTLIVNTTREPAFLMGFLKDLPEFKLLARVATIDAGLAHQPYAPQGGIEGAVEQAAVQRTASMLIGAVARATGLVKLETLLGGSADRAAVQAGYDAVKITANAAYDPAARTEKVAEFGFRGVVDLIVAAPKPNGCNDVHITGNYRIMRPVVDQTKCNECRICWSSCPDACISLPKDGNEKIRIDLAYCKGCGICWEVCPRNCIEAREEIDFPGDVVRIAY